MEKKAGNLESNSVKTPVLHCGDNLPWMETLPDGCCDLIYADPPFFSQRKRSGTTAGPEFDDRWPGGMASYLDFLELRLIETRRLLSNRGSLYVHLDFRTVHQVRLLLDRLFGSDHFLNEIIWVYRTGGISRRWFARKHDSILLYAKDIRRHTFHVLRGGTFRTDGMLTDSEGRPFKKTRNGPLYFHADGPALTDVWDIPFLSTVSKERTGYPTQKPEALLERIIRASSNPGDTVADFFCGSGTTLAVASKLGRRVLGCDENPEAVAMTRSRISKNDNSLKSARGITKL